MFKINPFSFSGRIRRTEFALSYLIFIFAIFFAGLVNAEFFKRNSDASNIVTLIVMIPSFWFLLAQGVKRSHDIGNSGWFLLIPLYGLFLVFGDGESGRNKFGADPKRKDDETLFSFERQSENNTEAP